MDAKEETEEQSKEPGCKRCRTSHSYGGYPGDWEFLTLRDRIAIEAMKQILAAPQSPGITTRVMAAASYEMADLMLAARSTRGGK